ncbi:hypothetical protein J3Q64DRAFT_1722228 [Phycomyces blakesleeanus]|uniref:Uncharacterized protein n=2 Tax=Phycomyces blakesleeanus TaxID=4837 RepID=A0A163E4X2_PHYB8|nr:hypothetical protein PHYBLDRAFT_142175 [Phycomyces blakesleeanus NRRL 1555(-)]OAD76660.1 hypothetical protein PHYBLDRAFT_142175 [Phycomyces blakesleeanus NRRL 1555(-)]|eukprot:XP_018294700.1 hypothetical protein PHYBLDRAFT_142175 [Phycomyces blakesleeanus NRRL 1555(-)]
MEDTHSHHKLGQMLYLFSTLRNGAIAVSRFAWVLYLEIYKRYPPVRWTGNIIQRLSTPPLVVFLFVLISSLVFLLSIATVLVLSIQTGIILACGSVLLPILGIICGLALTILGGLTCLFVFAQATVAFVKPILLHVGLALRKDKRRI